MHVIEAKAVSHCYESGTGSFEALRDFELCVERNEFLCLLGPSGCGKSTFLRIIAGLTKPKSGEVLLHGKPITGPGLDRGIVFQEPVLFPWLTVIRNVEFGLLMGGWKQSAARDRAYHVLEIVGLAANADWYPYQLSGGMKNRASVARAWALKDADVLLMDEPFTGADAITRATLQNYLMNTWSAEPRTVLYVTHDVEEAVCLADTIAVLTPSPGRVGKIFRVNGARPRDPSAPEFSELKATIRAFMQQLDQQGNSEHGGRELVQ